MSLFLPCIDILESNAQYCTDICHEIKRKLDVLNPNCSTTEDINEQAQELQTLFIEAEEKIFLLQTKINTLENEKREIEDQYTKHVDELRKKLYDQRTHYQELRMKLYGVQEEGVVLRDENIRLKEQVKRLQEENELLRGARMERQQWSPTREIIAEEMARLARLDIGSMTDQEGVAIVPSSYKRKRDDEGGELVIVAPPMKRARALATFARGFTTGFIATVASIGGVVLALGYE